MTRKRCIRGWSVFAIVVLVMQMAGGLEPAAATQAPAPLIRGWGHQTLVPQDDARVERLVGGEAWRLLEEKAIAKHRKAWEAALKVKEERGWKRTNTIVALRTRSRTGLTKTQAQGFDIGDGLLIEWQWDCGPDAACGTYYYESYYFGSNIVYDASFVPTSDYDGYSPWTNYIGGSPGRDSRRQREAFAADRPGLRLASAGGGQDANCPGDLYYWRQCMRGCLERQHSGGMRGAAGAAGGSLLGCLGKMRAGSLAMMGLSYIGCVTLTSGAGALLAFSISFTWEPCDSYGQCGPNPC